VYLDAPDETGIQRLRWIDTVSGETVTEIATRADDSEYVRAGQFIYFHAPGSREPRRVNTAGAIQPVSFANPPLGATNYQFLPSGTGNFVSWVNVDCKCLPNQLRSVGWYWRAAG
jgi:hypothetical protein